MAKERINKINEEVMRELAVIIRELKDARIPMLTSVVSVNVTNDLSYAKAYISVYGDENVQKEAIKGLGDREKLILNLRFMQGKTQMEVAEEVGISQAQVSRLEKGAIKKIKEN